MDRTTEIKNIRDYLFRQDELELGIVFGSVAAGQPGPDSDLDIALLGRQPMDAGRKMKMIRELAKLTGRSIDLVDLKTVGEPLLGQILSTGLRLMGDDRCYARLISRHLVEQADFLPYRDRLLAERRKAWIQP